MSPPEILHNANYGGAPAAVIPLPVKPRRRTGAPWLAREAGRPNYYLYWYDGKRVRRRSAKTESLVEAEARLADLARELAGGRVAAAASNEWEAAIPAMIARQKISAKARGIPFSIAASYVQALMERAGWVCSVSGIPFSAEKREFHKNPWAPSIDRIDNRQGYIRGNIRVVCLAVNLAMNEWGYDVLLRIAHAVVDNSFARPETKGE